MKTHRFSFRVRYVETDTMGVVYHSNYYVFMEIGRAELFRSLGKSYADMEKLGFFLPVVETWCKYKKPAYYDQEIIVELILNISVGQALSIIIGFVSSTILS